MELVAGNPADYLAADDIVNHDDPSIRDLAQQLRASHPRDVDLARAAFEYVRDEVTHSWDAQDPRGTLRASDALEQGTGLCYAKAHLLASLLRAEGIPTGLCYQLLTDDETTFMLHGLVAIHLEGSWHRQDPRGTRLALTHSSVSTPNSSLGPCAPSSESGTIPTFSAMPVPAWSQP